MFTLTKMQTLISLILLVGIMGSMLLVLIGGTLYLMQEGSMILSADLLQTNLPNKTILPIWQAALTLSPIGIIQLGLLFLVITQILRVALLVGFYILTADYWFSLFSLFILLTLLYSLFWRD